MNIKILASLTLLAATLTVAVTAAKAEDTEPYILRETVLVYSWRYGNYYATPKAKEPQYNTWSWRPRYFFTVAGPLAGGSQISVSFYKPDGTLWFTQPCQTPEVAEGATANITNPNEGQEAERQTITTTGTFTFKVTLKNELTSTNKTLYNGKFTVGKFHSGPNVPVNKNQFEYYVEHDWLLPIGYLFFDVRQNEEAPPMRLLLWFRGETKQEDVAAYVFYKGKQICSTKVSDEGMVSPKFGVSTTGSDPDPMWRSVLFLFHNVASSYKEISSANKKPDWHFLDANPGDYEIKVLRNGKLARSVTFTVGEDGKVVDNGVAKKNKMSDFVRVVPVKILPGADGKAKPETYKTDAFYGNPLAGFMAP